MTRTTLTLALTLAGGLVLASCDNPQITYESADAPVEGTAHATDVAVAEDNAAPAAAETVEPAEPQAPNESLPPSVQSSEESVQPDSETLFY